MLAATLWVDAASTKAADFHTIQAAVNAANTGDTIKVAPGIYTESVTVSKAVTISGGLPHLPGESGPSIIQSDTTAFTLSASSTTIKGFTITTASAAGNGVAVGISTGPTQSGDTIQNNIIQGEFVGVALNSPTTGTVLASAVSNNQFQNNGTAIASTLGLENAKISGNTFSADATWSVAVNGTGASNVQIVNNQFTNDAPLLLVNADSSKIANNTITNPIADGIDLFGGVTNTAVTGNTLSASPAVFSDGIFAVSELSDAANTGNRFANNSIAGIGIGIELIVSTGSTISANNVSNESLGIDILGGDASITNNNANGSGIQTFADGAITATGNTANGGNGMDIFAGGDIVLNGNTANGFGFDIHGANVTAIGNTADDGSGILIFGDTIIVRNNQTNGNTLDGLTAFGTTVTATGNTANGNGDTGIDINAPTGTVTGNTADGNGGDGFFLNVSTGKISNNTADSNLGSTAFNSGGNFNSAGIVVNGETVSVTGNTSTNNTEDGFLFESLDGSTVANNTATGNGEFGISVFESTSCTLSGNTASNNASDGFQIRSDAATLKGNTANDNGGDGFLFFVNQGTVINNSADSNQGINTDPNSIDDGGFVFDGGALTLRRNSSTNNAQDGFLLRSTGGTIAKNTATGNGDDGFLLQEAGTNVFGPGINTFTANVSQNNGNDGFDLSDCAGNVLENNTASGNTVFDLSDDSTGSGTAGTANTWTNNTANTSNPADLN
jgi:parallel beta-helix repeat protein